MSYSRKLFQMRQKYDQERRPVIKGYSSSSSSLKSRGESKEGKVRKGANVMPPTTKGINLQRFQNNVQKLKEYTDLPNTTGNEDALKQYHAVLSTMGTVEDPATYETLSRIIHASFQNDKMFPGTIGSTLSGCHVNYKDAHVVEPGCTPTCAGALKATSDSPECGRSIYLVEVNPKGGFNIKRTYTTGEGKTDGEPVSDKAYLYVPRSKDRKFHKPNLDVRTLEYLKNDGIKTLKFVGYDAYNQLLVSLHQDDLDLDSLYPSNEIHKRVQTSYNQRIQRNPTQQNASFEWDWTTIILLVAILVAAYFVFKSFRSSSS